MNSIFEIKEIQNYVDLGIKVKRIIWGGVMNFHEKPFPKMSNKFFDEKTYEESIIKENVYPCVIVRQDVSGKKYYYLVDRVKRNYSNNI